MSLERSVPPEIQTNKQTKKKKKTNQPLGEEIRSLILDITFKCLLDIQIDCLSVGSWYLESSGDVWTEGIILGIIHTYTIFKPMKLEGITKRSSQTTMPQIFRV